MHCNTQESIEKKNYISIFCFNYLCRNLKPINISKKYFIKFILCLLIGQYT